MFAAVGLPLSRRLACSLLLAPAVVLVACTASRPPQPTAARPTSAASSAAPKAAASPGAAARPSPSPAPAGIQILDATLADATPWVLLRLTGGEPQIVSGWRLEVGDQAVTV